MSDLSNPQAVLERLAAIENDLAIRQNVLEQAARAWYIAKRDREKSRAEVFIRTEGTIAERNAQADIATAQHGQNDEAEYEALKAVVRVLETRASIGQSILKAQTTQAHALRSVA
jgi:hypothetical protein